MEPLIPICLDIERAAVHRSDRPVCAWYSWLDCCSDSPPYLPAVRANSYGGCCDRHIGFDLLSFSSLKRVIKRVIKWVIKRVIKELCRVRLLPGYPAGNTPGPVTTRSGTAGPGTCGVFGPGYHPGTWADTCFDSGAPFFCLLGVAA